MYKKFRLLSFAFIALFFTGCLNDNRDPQPQFLQSLVTIENPELKKQFFMRRDDDKLLWFAEGYTDYFKPEDGSRYLIYYNILSDKTETGMYDYDVRVTDAMEVLTKDIFNITPETQDSIGNDWTEINSLWIGRNYLNISFHYKGYANDTPHYINLVSDSSKVFTDNKIHLEFRHNANNDDQFYRFAGLASFDISALQVEDADSVMIAVHVSSFDDTLEQIHNVTYKYGNANNNDNTSEEEPKPVLRKTLNSFVQ